MSAACVTLLYLLLLIPLFVPIGFVFSAQLVEVTGRTQDECMVSLHDCNEDVNRAINLLLEGVTDQV